MGGEKKIKGDVNQLDDERNRRASIFLPINSLKMAKINTSRFDVSKLYPVWLIDSLVVSLC